VAHVARRPGNKVTVVAPVPYFPSWLRFSRWKHVGLLPKQERIGELEVHHPRYPMLPKVAMPFHGLFMFLGCFFLVWRLNQEHRFDCIDAHYVYPDGFAAVLIARLLGIPVVVSARGSDINLFPSFSLIRPMICWTLRKASGLIAVSAALRQAMVQLGASGVEVVGNGVDVQRFQPVPRKAAREHTNLLPQDRIIVSVAALIPCKGHRFLIAAFAELSQTYPELKLVLIGEGELKNELHSQIRALNVEGRVILAGRISNEELKFWYSAAEVSCLASSREGWPNVLLESLACGTPVVATRVWGAPEVIARPGLGFLVDQDTRALAVALDLALSKEWDREAIVRFAQHRTWDVVADEVETYLQSVLNQFGRHKEAVLHSAS
jgi:glycosyltransferase involved in cell wall biosynthesis